MLLRFMYLVSAVLFSVQIIVISRSGQWDDQTGVSINSLHELNSTLQICSFFTEYYTKFCNTYWTRCQTVVKNSVYKIDCTLSLVSLLIGEIN